MADLQELGTTGLVRSGGVVDVEFLSFLKGATGRKFYREMADNSPIAGAVLTGFERMLQQLEWRVEPADPDNPQAVEVAEFVESCLHDMNDSWEATLTEICTMFVYGWSWHEVVYKQRGGPVNDPKKRSKHTDGKIGWRKFAPRSQDTLQRFQWDDDGDVSAMEQLDPAAGRGMVIIPIEKSLLFRVGATRGNPEGRSLLRGGAVAYFHQKRIREIEAIGIERDLAGLPVAYVPAEWLSGEATAGQRTALEAVQGIVAGIKRNEQEGVVLPQEVNPETSQAIRTVDLQLLSTGGSRQFDTDAIIARYSQEIAMSVLMDFLLLGHEAVGSKALSVSKIDLWLMSVDAIARSIADTITQHAIPKLLTVNGWNNDLCPELTYGSVEQFDADGMAAALQALIASGAILPDEALDEWVRDAFGLPVRSDEEPYMPSGSPGDGPPRDEQDDPDRITPPGDNPPQNEVDGP